MALRCARGEHGAVAIRDGRRTVELTPLGGLIVLLRPRGGDGRSRRAAGRAPSLDAAVAGGGRRDLAALRHPHRARLRAGARRKRLACGGRAWVETRLAALRRPARRPATPTTSRAARAARSARERLDGARSAPCPSDVDVVLHGVARRSSHWPSPLLPVRAPRLTAPAARRYLVGLVRRGGAARARPAPPARAGLQRRRARSRCRCSAARRAATPSSSSAARNPRAAAPVPARARSRATARLGLAVGGRRPVLSRPDGARAARDRPPPARGRRAGASRPAAPTPRCSAARVFDLLGREEGEAAVLALARATARGRAPAALERRLPRPRARPHRGHLARPPGAHWPRPASRTSSRPAARCRARRPGPTTATASSRPRAGARRALRPARRRVRGRQRARPAAAPRGRPATPEPRHQHVARAGGEHVGHVEAARCGASMLGIALLEQQALDELGLGLVARAGRPRTSSPSVYCGLDLAARARGGRGLVGDRRRSP